MLYLHIDGCTTGPFSKQEVAARWKEGAVNGLTLFITLESDQWMHLASISKELGQPPFAATPYAQAAALKVAKKRQCRLAVACAVCLLGAVNYYLISDGHPDLGHLGLAASLAGLVMAGLTRIPAL